MVDAKSHSIMPKSTINQEPKNDESSGEIVRDEHIRDAAYYKWEAAGCPCCDGVDFWLQAEAELIGSN